MPVRRLHGLTKTLIGLEFILALGAIAGGAGLMMAPDGSNLGMPVSMLKNSPFKDFFLPGLILLVFNGILPTVVAFASMLRLSWAGVGHMVVGLTVIIWIVVQVIMIGYGNALQPLYGIFGLVILCLGWLETRRITRTSA